eukprot:TRINITY_DN177_c1_g1_i1.p1 TRINITY_DN177_c1_g1~~TRINITY_DN177_c1_g1_i1.p1  ORF type:complete len:296 (-),score=115.53 TRINITY_DN177_c1_g1_i1:253-1140(-)
MGYYKYVYCKLSYTMPSMFVVITYRSYFNHMFVVFLIVFFFFCQSRIRVTLFILICFQNATTNRLGLALNHDTVDEVTKGSISDEAGICVGDKLIRIKGEPFDRNSDLAFVISSYPPPVVLHFVSLFSGADAASPIEPPTTPDADEIVSTGSVIIDEAAPVAAAGAISPIKQTTPTETVKPVGLFDDDAATETKSSNIFNDEQEESKVDQLIDEAVEEKSNDLFAEETPAAVSTPKVDIFAEEEKEEEEVKEEIKEEEVKEEIEEEEEEKESVKKSEEPAEEEKKVVEELEDVEI